MIGIDAEGKITGVKVTEHSETPGLGNARLQIPDIWNSIKASAKLPAASVKDDTEIDAVSGATITSNAVYCSVEEALKQFKECGGVK